MKSFIKLIFVTIIFKIVESSSIDNLSLDDDVGVMATPNVRAGRLLNKWKISNEKGNPEEQGGYFEGDIISDIEGRNGVISSDRKWKNAIIPYMLKGSFSKSEKNLLSDALEEYMAKTCIVFIPRGGEKDYIVFDNEQTGCWSHVGKIGGPQTINLQSEGCTYMIGTILHEILHALGFYHEQNRYDRDSFVKIKKDNIKAGTANNFEKVSATEISSYGVRYDYDSVVHYSAYAFSKNSKRTIEAINKSNNERMGQRVGFSKGDIDKINAMYCN